MLTLIDMAKALDRTWLSRGLGRRGWHAPALVAMVALGASCGSSQAEPASGPRPGTTVLAPGDRGPGLTCTGDERFSSSQLIAEDAVGAPSAKDAVTEFATGESSLVSAAGYRAWILREDGTAREQLGLIKADGWFITETLGC